MQETNKDIEGINETRELKETSRILKQMTVLSRQLAIEKSLVAKIILFEEIQEIQEELRI
jgi:hypothetical protein